MHFRLNDTIFYFENQKHIFLLQDISQPKQISSGINFLFDQKLFKRYDESGIRKRYLSIGSNLSIFISKPPPPMPLISNEKRYTLYKRESNDLIQSRI